MRPTLAKSARSLRLALLPFIGLSLWVFAALLRLFAARLRYPLDLEWMEGGTLTHALRLARGEALYAQPSVDFVSFLYTPLYPAVLGALSKLFGLSYVLGRSVSILAFAGALTVLVAAVRGIARQYESDELRGLAVAAGLLGAAAVCLAFPFCGAFYDLVRCDSLWLLLVAAGLHACAPPVRSRRRPALGALLLTIAFFTKQTAAPFMVAGALSVALTSGLGPGLLFSAVAFGGTAAGILIGQYLTDGWLWIYIYRLHQGHPLRLARIWPETPRALLEHGFVLLLPIAACLVFAAMRRRVSPRLFHWATMAAAGVATSAVASATEGAYDNAYIPAVYFVALLSAASVVELAALASGLSDALQPPRLRMAGLSGLLALSAHMAIRWLDPAPHIPTAADRAEATRLLAFLVEQGPAVFMPCHPYYNVLAGGRGHLHVMGISDVYYWPRSITSDPARDAAIKERFRISVRDSFASRRWKMVIDDPQFTSQLFGLKQYYERVADLAATGRTPRSLTGYPCAPGQVWVPR